MRTDALVSPGRWFSALLASLLMLGAFAAVAQAQQLPGSERPTPNLLGIGAADTTADTAPPAPSPTPALQLPDLSKRETFSAALQLVLLLTVLSRIGANSKVVLTHDVAQRDNLRVGRHDGIVAVVEKLKGHPLFAHVTLTRSERSPIAALVTEMLEDLPL